MDNEEVINKIVVEISKVITSPIYDHTNLKTAYKVGAEIQFNDPDCGWVSIKAPLWHDYCEYRIKPDLETLLREAKEFK